MKPEVSVTGQEISCLGDVFGPAEATEGYAPEQGASPLGVIEHRTRAKR